MDLLHNDARDRADRYLGTDDMIVEVLGAGTDGIIFSTSRDSAIKVYRRSDLFQQELAAYQRLADKRVHQICGHFVPILLDFDSHLLVLEMTTVRPPFVLDFGKALVDRMRAWDADVTAQWRKEVDERFGCEGSGRLADSWLSLATIGHMVRRSQARQYRF
jgi:hypothetical protein